MTRGIDVIDRFWLTFQVRNEIPQQQHRRRLFAFFMSFAYKLNTMYNIAYGMQLTRT